MGLFLALTIFAAVCRAGESFPADVSRWVPVIVPRDGNDAYWRFSAAASNSEYEWTVSVHRGQVVALNEPLKKPAPPFPLGGEEVSALIRHLDCARWARSVRVSDGWLVGYNGGEFGSVVFWYSEDGKKSREVSGNAINQFLTTADGVFAATGVNHLGSGSGAVVRFVRSDGKWVAKTVTDLSEAAYALAESERGKLLVMTGDRLVLVAQDGAFETLASASAIACPNSIAIGPRGVVYVGMRQFIGMYDPTHSDRGLQLLAPAKGFPRPRK